MSYPKWSLKTTYIEVLEFSTVTLHSLHMIYAVKTEIYEITNEIRTKLGAALN